MNLSNNKIYYSLLFLLIMISLILAYNYVTGKSIFKNHLIDFKTTSELNQSKSFNSNFINPRTGIEEKLVASLYWEPYKLYDKDSTLFYLWVEQTNKSNWILYLIDSLNQNINQTVIKDTSGFLNNLLRKDRTDYKLKLLIIDYLNATNLINSKIETDSVGVNYFNTYSKYRPWPAYFFNTNSTICIQDSLDQVRRDISSLQFNSDSKLNYYIKDK